MPRHLRQFEPGGIYHVTARGNRKQAIFLADDDRELFLSLFSRIAVRLSWRCHGYCLMPNHYHAVIELRDANLSRGLQFLNGGYAQAFNTRHGTHGHLFQGRFHAGIVERDGHLVELSRYLALNPVRAGLCRRPEQWPWSSYQATLGIRNPPVFLDVLRVLEFWATDPRRAMQIFERFVCDAGRLPPSRLGHI
jgi:putative transposase